MKYNITKTTTTLLGLLLSFYASISFGASNTLNNKTNTTFFGVSNKWSHPFFDNFSIKETPLLSNVRTDRVIGLHNDLLESADELLNDINSFDFSQNYIPKYYDISLFGLSFLIGHSFQDFRIEFEGFYEKFDVKNDKSHIIDENRRHFALFRAGSLFFHDYVTLRNDGVEFYSAMLNICYDLRASNTDVIPFSCIGIGGDVIKIFNTVDIKPAFQAKVGVNYFLVYNKVSLFIDGYYHKVIGNQYNDIPVQYPITLFSDPIITSAFARLDIDYLGAEVGLKIFI